MEPVGTVGRIPEDEIITPMIHLSEEGNRIVYRHYSPRRLDDRGKGFYPYEVVEADSIPSYQSSFWSNEFVVPAIIDNHFKNFEIEDLKKCINRQDGVIRQLQGELVSVSRAATLSKYVVRDVENGVEVNLGEALEEASRKAHEALYTAEGRI